MWKWKSGPFEKESCIRVIQATVTRHGNRKQRTDLLTWKINCWSQRQGYSQNIQIFYVARELSTFIPGVHVKTMVESKHRKGSSWGNINSAKIQVSPPEGRDKESLYKINLRF
ncbi:hypothetical protein E2C01_030993 [Portunus trituberculatus]|uniref:Uncharacterized protein n=1 Tax=Portunus trituberculatus TaxID=210409 RepID=A0A5B7ETB9_PORTR|nr:hypothetical protein [Portunus trituberculatus]